jgi:hypothetical protein
MDLAQGVRLSTKDWKAFCSGYSPFRFGEVADRNELNLPRRRSPKRTSPETDLVATRAARLLLTNYSGRISLAQRRARLCDDPFR